MNILSSGNWGAKAETCLNLSRITRQSIRERVLRSPRLQAAIQEAEEQSLDLPETRLVQMIDEGDVSATKFYLETKGRRRGYSRRPLHFHPSDPKLLSD